MSDLQHKGNAVTIMGKMKARNGENAIIIWDGTGDVNLTANDEEFFMFVMVRSIIEIFAHIPHQPCDDYHPERPLHKISYPRP